MPKSDLELRVRYAVEDFVRKITDLVNQQVVRAVQDTLSTKAGRASAARGVSSAPQKRGRPPSPKIAALAERFQAFVRSNPGLRLEEIAREMGVPSKELKYPVSKLLDAGALRTEGQARGTRYYPTGRGGGVRRKKTARQKAAGRAAPRRKRSATRKKATARRKATSKKRR